LYDLARQGKTVTVPTRTVQVFAITPVQWQPGEFPELTVDITCGSGTYIRSIARDWGQVLGTGATLAGLQRTASSGFTRATSMTLEALAATLEEGNFEPIAPAIVLQHLPSLVLPSDLAQRWQQGQKILYTPSDPALDADCWRVHAPDNQFLGITSWERHDLDPSSNTIRLLPKVVFQN
jgi:tRNA pseudouridine55 synthase